MEGEPVLISFSKKHSGWQLNVGNYYISKVKWHSGRTSISLGDFSKVGSKTWWFK